MQLYTARMFFDNIFASEVCKELNENSWDIPSRDSCKEKNQKEPIRKVLDSLALKFSQSALDIGKDVKKKTPFSVNANKAGYYYEGGKLDDVTVITSLVVAS